MRQDTHLLSVGYILWIFGFTGSHRFYFGKKKTGLLWFFTLGLFGVGWLLDLFFMASLEKSAELRYKRGPLNYTIAWIFLTFLGIFGAHRLYMGKWISAILYFFTGGLFLVGYLYDFWTLNEQVSEINNS